jgi:hypothetical protein
MHSDGSVCVTFVAVTGSLLVAAWLWWRDRRWDREAATNADRVADERR